MYVYIHMFDKPQVVLYLILNVINIYLLFYLLINFLIKLAENYLKVTQNHD